MFNHKDSIDRLYVDGEATGLLEVFAAGDHGLTLYYNFDKGKWAPVLKAMPDADKAKRNINHLRSGIFDFLSFMPIRILRTITFDEDLQKKLVN